MFPMVAVALIAFAQISASPISLSDGASIAVRIKKTVKADKANVGDPVVAEVAIGVLEHGRIVIPAGARVTGHVLAARARQKDQSDSVLSIRFERAEWQGGTAELNAYIVAMLANRPGSRRDNCFPSPMFPARLAPPRTPIVTRFQSQNPNTLNGVGQPIHSSTGAATMSPPRGGTAEWPCATPGPEDLHYISVRRLEQPRGVTELIGSRKNVVLPAGIAVELRQVGP